jgi:hypothetical protein
MEVPRNLKYGTSGQYPHGFSFSTFSDLSTDSSLISHSITSILANKLLQILNCCLTKAKRVLYISYYEL